jgi:hypothetical protein
LEDFLSLNSITPNTISARHLFSLFSFSFSADEPTIVHQPPKKIEASVGERVHMKCGADGTPSPALCWSRIGYGGSLTTVGSGQELILDRILYQEAGNYRCVAQNRVGLEERRAMTHDVTVVVSGK